MYDFRTFNVDLLGVAMEQMGDQIRVALEAFWEDHAIPNEGGEPSTVDDLIGPVESMVAVEMLVVLDQITGMKLPNSIIQAGGYATKEEFVKKLGDATLAYVSMKLQS